MIIVIGGGIGGLALIYSLHKNGIECMLFERDEDVDLRNQGYALTIQGGNFALEFIGVTFEDEYQQFLTGQEVYNSQGILMSSKDSIEKNYVVPRRVIRQKLYDRCISICCTIHWDKEFQHYSSTHVYFTDGNSYPYDGLIGADGIRSKVRYDLLGKNVVNSFEIERINGITSLNQFRSKSIEVIDTDLSTTLKTRLFIKPYSKGQIMWQLTYRFNHNLYEWNQKYIELINMTPNYFITTGTICDVLIDSIPEGNVTLLGDAAHAMSPYKGQGANNALLDVIDLVLALKENKSISEAFRVYNNKMLSRSREMVLASRKKTMSQHCL